MTSPEIYAERAQPGIDRTVEPDSQVYPLQAAGSIFRGYNIIMDRAGRFEDLDALVLVHQDAEIVDPDFCAKVRAAVADPEVAIAGCVGAVGTRTIAWWEADVSGGSAVCRYGELGGGALPAVAFGGDGTPRTVRTGPVDTVDGFLMVLSPWAVRTLSFDESLGQLYGFDFDISLQARAAGKRVLTADFGVVHHHSLDLVTANEPWMAAHARVAEKWDGRLPHLQEDSGPDWRRRGLRAEAEAAAARLLVRATELQASARIEELERDLQRITHSSSWRVTESLRRANARQREWRGKLGRRRGR